MRSSDSQPAGKKLVLLVHGIRTRALWQSRIAPQLTNENTIVEAVGYGYLNVFQFLFPFLTRKRAIESIRWRIQKAIDDHPDHELTIIAHSFGTYCVGEILHALPGVKPTRLILCGAVVNDDFRWDQLRQQPEIINECGTKDVWPCLARSMTWGYGSSGAFGFKTPGVADRYHRIPHSGYFKAGFAAKFWAPFAEDGAVVQPAGGPITEPPFWMSLIAIRLLGLPWLGWILLIMLAILVAIMWPKPLPPKDLAIVGIFPGDSFGPDCRAGFLAATGTVTNIRSVIIDGTPIREMKAGRTQRIQTDLRAAFDKYNVIGVVGPPVSEITFEIASFASNLNSKVPLLVTSAVSENDGTWTLLKQKMPLFRVGSGIGQRAEGVQGCFKYLLAHGKRIIFLVEYNSEDAPRSFGLRFFDAVENQMSHFSNIPPTDYERVTFPSNRVEDVFPKLAVETVKPDTAIFLMGLDFQMAKILDEFYKMRPDTSEPHAQLIGWMNAHVLDRSFSQGAYYSQLVTDISDVALAEPTSGSGSAETKVLKRDWVNYHDSAMVILTAAETLLQKRHRNRKRQTHASFLVSLADLIGETTVSGASGPIHFDSSGQNVRPLSFLRFDSLHRSWRKLHNPEEIFGESEQLPLP